MAQQHQCRGVHGVLQRLWFIRVEPLRLVNLIYNTIFVNYMCCFQVRGPEDTPYFGGVYHGKLVFPKEFPFLPPAIYMITPSGRFECNIRLCLSISDYHPKQWNPGWSVAAILTGLLSFMLEDTPTVGSIQTSTHVKRTYARSSGKFNLRDDLFCQLFPDIVKELTEKTGT